MGKATGIIVVVVAALISIFLPFNVLPTFLREAFEGGRWGMRPILFSFLVSAWLALDRAIVLVRGSLNAQEFNSTLQGLLSSGNINGAVQYCEQVDKPLSRIVAAGLRASALGEKKVKNAMDEVAYGELPKLEIRTGYLALMGNVATLMGLFGTIIGLIHSFSAVSKTGVGEKATMLAAGISEAMNCTAFGLLSGISALFFFSVLNGKTQGLLDEINHLSLKAFRMWKQAARQQGAHSPAHAEAHMIHPPAAHLLGSVGLHKGGGHGSHGRGRKSTFANLQLTPLIDMFIVMVIFLLMSFSATGELGRVAKDIKLPFAEKVDAIQRAPVVAVSFPKDDPSGGVVILEGNAVSTAKELLDDDSPDWNISRLKEQLEVFKNNWKVTHPSESFNGDLILQVDQNVDFKIIKKVMYTAGIAGYTNLMFAVTQKAKGGGGEAAAE
ncbi:MAG: MotA/TolQ/ExbB proton channel family protein [Deltaproteobacteria bacterium]|nr:MotA/TolQ/ExbB proton channel family protein [Deltaproteobacteria bacterium]